MCLVLWILDMIGYKTKKVDNQESNKNMKSVKLRLAELEWLAVYVSLGGINQVALMFGGTK